ncbi:magnesium transporter MgtE N-terminal domain-containing protein [Ruminococcus flavefaciens]|uniref:magnesium transporter MgtE N-terminal domain-containing protein n=1 Tax=Ruminococcus flavefaciens TaxID=1265 RepID=UPI0026F19301|nr:hypothetical protein [Ruminococcus flavefaciens]
MKIKSMIVSAIVAFIAAASCSPIVSSAATVGDVIAYAYQVGMPDDMIQQYIAMGSGREWSSEQCDQAIAALSAWAAERDGAISGGGQPQQSVPDPVEPETFEEMSIEEKQEYITAIPSDQKQEYLNVMTNDEKNQLLKQLDSSEQVEIMAGMLGFGDPFGINFSIEDVSDGSVMISARDEDNKLVGVTVLGDSVEKTGKTYPVPILAALGTILLSVCGIAVMIKKGRCE